MRCSDPFSGIEGEGELAPALAFAATGLARPPTIVTAALRGAHEPQGGTVEVLPAAWQPGPEGRETIWSSWGPGTAMPFPSKLAGLPSWSVKPSSLAKRSVLG